MYKRLSLQQLEEKISYSEQSVVEEYMNRLLLGRLSIILGCLILSMELFGLKIL